MQADARVADDLPPRDVDGVDAVEAGHVEDRAARVLGGVAVGAAEAAGDRAARPALPHRPRRLLVAAGPQRAGGGGRGAAPAGERGGSGGGGGRCGVSRFGGGLGSHGRDRIARKAP